jgi:hypothetical protein
MQFFIFGIQTRNLKMIYSYIETNIKIELNIKNLCVVLDSNQ